MKKSATTYDIATLSIPVGQGFSLTPLLEHDVDALIEHLNDPVIFHNTLTVPYPYRSKDADIFLRSVKRFEKLNNIIKDFALRNPEGRQVGGIGILYNYGLDSHRSEVGYWLAKAYRNRGLMTQAINACVDWVWKTTDLIRLDAQVFTGNDASGKVLQKAGFVYEGTQCAAVKKGDALKDVMIYAILRPEGS